MLKSKIFWLVLLINLVAVTNKVSAQFIPQQSAQIHRLAADTLYGLTGCGVPSFHPNSYKRVVLYFDSCGNIMYCHDPKTQTWNPVGNSTSFNELIADAPLYWGDDDTTLKSHAVDTNYISGGHLFARWDHVVHDLGPIAGALTSTYIGFGDGSNQLSGSSNLTYSGNSLNVFYNGLGVSPLTSLSLSNTTAATSLSHQYSPLLNFHAQGWSGANLPVDFFLGVEPFAEGTTYGKGNLVISANVDGHARYPVFQVNSDGTANATYFEGSYGVVSDNITAARNQLQGGTINGTAYRYKLTNSSGTTYQPSLWLSTDNLANNLTYDHVNGLNFVINNNNGSVATWIPVAGIGVTDTAVAQGQESGGLGIYTKNKAGSRSLRANWDSIGRMKLTAYGSGAIMGTAAYGLAVDASHNIIEVPLGGGGGGSPAGNYGNIQLNRNGALATPASDSLSFNSHTLYVLGDITGNDFFSYNTGQTQSFSTNPGNLQIQFDAPGNSARIDAQNITGVKNISFPNVTGNLAEGITNGTTTVHANTSGLVNISTLLSGSSTFAGLSDVNITSIANGQLIKYNSSSGKYENFTPSYLTANQSITITQGGDIAGTASGTTGISLASTVTGIKGVSVPTLAPGFFKYNGSAWVFDNSSYSMPLTVTAVKTSNYSINANEFVPTDCSSGSVTITLPNAPANGTRVSIKMINVASSNTTTINCSGSDVFNKVSGSTSGSLSLLNQAINLQYYSTSGIWYVYADDISLSAMDARFSALAGSSSIVTVGTIASGVWNGTAINNTYINSVAWSKITSAPTTLSGYGITDAAPLASPTFTGTVTIPNGAILGTPTSGNFSSGSFTWPTFNQNTTGYAGGLSGGNNTTLLGSLPYQSNTNTTSLLSPNTSATQKFLTQTGTGTNGAAPTWTDLFGTAHTWSNTQTLATGTTSLAPLNIPPGTLKTTPASGDIENDGTAVYATNSGASRYPLNYSSGWQTYSGSPTWDGTAPTTTSAFQYYYSQNGKMVTLLISLIYTNPGTTNTTVTIPWPSGVPTPLSPSGYSGNNQIELMGTGMISTGVSNTGGGSQKTVFGTDASSNPVIQVSGATSMSAKVVRVQITYPTN